MVVVAYVAVFGSVCCLVEGRQGGVFMTVSKIAFGYTVWFSFKWLFAANCVNVKSFKCVQVGSVFMAMQYLHDTVRGTEGVSFFIKAFRETGCVSVVSEGFLVPLVPRGHASTSLSYVYFITVGTG